MWPFGNRLKDQIGALAEALRVLTEKEVRISEKRYDAELRRLEYEEKTIDSRLRHEGEMAKWREEVRQARRAAQTERNKTLPRDSQGRLTSAKGRVGGGSACRVCDDPSDISLTAGEILNHNRGHLSAPNNLPTGTYTIGGRTFRAGQDTNSPVLANNGASADAPLPTTHSK
jgi:hypothetical protein